MPLFRIYRMKESARQQFRWAAHTSGISQVRPKDYAEGGQIEATGFYAAWTTSRAEGTPLEVGDLLEREGKELRICKYVGFEEARWIVPEVKSGLEDAPLAAGQPA
jgi:hypothetical protein